jgi:hypothetical protein
MKQDLNNYTFLLLYLMGGREKWPDVKDACAARWVGEEVCYGLTCAEASQPIQQGIPREATWIEGVQ